ncbi:MAG TPA: hypothetical protein VFE37_10290 [Chloroflexota bacterium]|nr:hypothetical protein [Chloroflexota bacterium]
MCAAFALVNAFTVDQMDYWWTVKLGSDLWTTRQLPTANTLAFTPMREPYVEQQWLAQLILAAIHTRWGLEGGLLLRGALFALGIGLLYYLCRRAGAYPTIAGVVCLGAAVLTFPGATVRPQLLALPLFMLFLAGTTAWQGRAWTSAALPLAMVVWVNVHGSFPMGLVLVGCALAGRLWEVRAPAAIAADPLARRLALALALCTAAVLVNPYGLHIVPWLIGFITIHGSGQADLPMASEWLPTSLGQRVGLYYFASVAAVVVVLIRTGPPAPAAGFRLLLFGALGLSIIRSTTWWGFVMAPPLARGGSQWLDQVHGERPLTAPLGPAPGADTPPRRALHGALLVVCLLAAVWSVPMVRGAVFHEALSIADPTQPRAAAEFVATLPGGLRLFNDLDWGGYLGWRLAPVDRVFADERFGDYPPAVYHDYARVSEARAGWDALLDGYGVDALILSRQHQPDLIDALAGHPAWQPVYADEQAVVYLRQDAGAASATER